MILKQMLSLKLVVIVFGLNQWMKSVVSNGNNYCEQYELIKCVCMIGYKIHLLL